MRRVFNRSCYSKLDLLKLKRVKVIIEKKNNQGSTNQVSGRPGQPENRSGQPDTEAQLPGGQPRFLPDNMSCFHSSNRVYYSHQLYWMNT